MEPFKNGILRVAVVGGGAVGNLLAAALAQAGDQVSAADIRHYSVPSAEWQGSV